MHKHIMSRTFLFLPALLLSELSEATEIEATKGPNITNQCTIIGGERVVFRAQRQRVFSEERAKRWIRHQDSCQYGHSFDDLWYWWRLSDTKNNFLYLGFNNLDDKHEYGWVVLENTPEKWIVHSSHTTFNNYDLANPEKVKIDFTVNGHLFYIDVQNPENTEPMTSNHIWYSFGP